MPSHDAKHASAERAGGPDPLAGSSGRRLSRRSLLQTAATAGAAGLAVTALAAVLILLCGLALALSNLAALGAIAYYLK